MRRLLVTWAITMLAATCHSQESPAQKPQGVRVETLKDRLKITMDGALFTEYVFTNSSRPYCYPIYGPGQVPMTRSWPMEDVPGEEHDHPHHRAFWYAHGALNGIDFWSEMPGAGKVVHMGFDAVQSGKKSALVKTRNAWVAQDGKTICTDERTLRFTKPAGASPGRLMDFEVTIHASHGDLTFGDTKEGTMAIRVAENMRVRGNKTGKGHIVNSEGVRDAATWGVRAKWCDYYGDTAGVAMFDHPSNPRYPTWWHVRDYGLFAANPFGKHDFEKLSDPAAGNLKVKSGSSVTFKYRFLFHNGDEREGNVAQEYERYAKQP